MCHIFFTLSSTSVSEHYGSFHVLALVSCAAVKFELHVCFKLVFSLDRHPRSNIPGSYDIIFAFNVNFKLLSLYNLSSNKGSV